MKRFPSSLVLVLIASSAFAAGSTSPRLAIFGEINSALIESNMSYYENFGLGAQLDMTPLVSLRPSLICYSSSTKSENILAGTPEYKSNSLSNVGVRIEAPLHFMRFQSGSVYAGPSVAYQRFSEKDYENPTDPYVSYEVQSDGISLGAIIGGQYNFGNRVSCFLDLGLEYKIESSSKKSYNSLGVTTANVRTKDGTFSFMPARIGLCIYLN